MAAEDPLLQPRSFAVLWPALPAGRGSGTFLQGAVAADVLAWLQADPAWEEVAAILAAGGHQSDSGRACMSEEEKQSGLKFEEIGFATRKPRTPVFCNLKVDTACRATRASSFCDAFMQCNREWLVQLSARVREALRIYPAAFLAQNGQDLFTECFSVVAFNYVLTQVLRTDERRDPKHFDGGASLLHMGLTVFGARELECWLADQTSCVFKQVPGSLYVGTMAAIEHQVAHDPAWSLQLCGPQGFQIVLQFRCDVFRHARGRANFRKPTPSVVFDVFNDIVVKHMVEQPLHIPELQDCVLGTGSVSVAALDADSPSTKRPKV